MKTISNRLLQDWLRVTRARGHDVKALLHAAGIPWRCYENTRAHINGEQLARLNTEIRRLLGDQFMGFGREAVSPALLERFLIKILAQAKNLREILLEWESFWNLVQSNGSTSIDFGNHELVYRFKFNTAQRPGTYVWILDSTMLKLQLFSWMIGRPIQPGIIGFAEPAPTGASEYLGLLAAEVRFDQPQNFFTIDKKHLDCPVVRTLDECLNYRQYLPGDFFAIPGDDRRLTPSVERLLEDELKTLFRLPTIDSIARQLSLSARGLRRKLESEGESFQHLKDRIRYDLAVKKLAGAKTPIGAVAADLGFSGTAAFSRAFKSWAAVTPQEYRIRLAAPHRQS